MSTTKFKSDYPEIQKKRIIEPNEVK